ncbi:hypothetical protein N0V85_003926 [Neurospora sp. IMI 360204]|nr:hypothetical protein N0V85_003926 [Neurospora sp. IMI 360204]
MATPKVLTIPIKLDAFIFNAAVCGGDSTDPNDDSNKNLAKIAPLTQPNYSFLRFDKTLVQNDILDFADLHKTGPAPFNPRFTDLGTGQPLTNRQGVYLHWIVPRPYRLGSTISQDPQAQAKARAQRGFSTNSVDTQAEPRAEPASRSARVQDDDDEEAFDDGPVNQGDTVAPDFHPAPPRWLVIRKCEECDPPGALPEVDAWVVESDRRQDLDAIPTDSPTVDLQTDFAPYIVGADASSFDDNWMNRQAMVFIGYKESASTWTEKGDAFDRVDLNVLNSSNQLFPDYQPHNGNVFSVIDNLQSTSAGKGKDADPVVVKYARLSYYVLGWHAKPGQDPFGNLDLKITREQRLSSLNMMLTTDDPPTAAGIKTWLASSDPTRVICHGAMYNVLWDKYKKPPIVPADEQYRKLNKHMAVSVGTTPMDALLTYCKSHATPHVSDDANDIKEVEQDLLRIQKLLHALDDGVDAQAEADDIVYNWNYETSAGGSHFFLGTSDAGKDGDSQSKPTVPAPAMVQALCLLNNKQAYLDGLKRQLQLLRWHFFSLWWRYLSDLKETVSVSRADVSKAATELSDYFGQVITAATAVTNQKALLPPNVVHTGVLQPYCQARDPTMLVAGIESGWPWDFLDKLRARVDTQLYYASGERPDMDDAWAAFCKTVLPKLGDDLEFAALALVGEFLALNPGVSSPPAPEKGYRDPLYHDVDKAHPLPSGVYPWRDRWEQSQAWFPLFLEWEAEYTDIPLEGKDDPNWTLGPRSAFLDDPVKLRYGITNGVELATLQPPLNDRRTVAGRVLILPQPNLNLQTLVRQILEKLPPGYLDPDQVKELNDHLHELAFLSSPLSGFTNHLLTRVEGNHVKPTIRVAAPKAGDPAVQPFEAAVKVGADIGFGSAQLTAMGIDTSLVPYGTLVAYLDVEYSPFKPATHGQFRFTALNILDKFGQAIHAIDPTPTKVGTGPPPLYPCISEYYVPEPLDEDPLVANTVKQDAERLCQYVQLPPSINQPARLNAAFIDYLPADEKRGTRKGWQPLTEWDDPIWGWVVPNYADSGIQIFLPDGTFFREVRLGGPKGATEPGAWLPFDAPSTAVSSDPNVKQLQKFTDALADKDYLHSFVAMVNMSTGTAAPPPNAYSEFLSSIIGKPLALVKMGFSLELATNQYANTSYISGVPANLGMPLLPDNSDPSNHYQFQMRFGDISCVYDGLIGYFNPSKNPQFGDVLELDAIYTHFKPDPNKPDDPPTPNLTKIAPANYPLISPFWVDPMSLDILHASDPGTAYTQQRVAKLQPFGAIVDPFVPVHAYTGILPTRALSLPTWSWQTALEKMTAFFHMGPLLAAQDVSGFKSEFRLDKSYNLADPTQVFPGSGLGIPAMQTGEWAWLQPYSIRPDGTEGGEDATTDFMAMDMAAVDERPRFQPAPYTALEGYMQLRQAIGQAVDPGPKPKPKR